MFARFRGASVLPSKPSLSFLFDAYISSGGQIAAGKMKALAVTSPERLQVLPNVPTFKKRLPKE
ncbi:hypothetical protein GCM10009107_20380 [Ideonella azotifigens]|uniref:Uncharacterized protein n=1 Tax=Ideonella azotifigens TaxID=513160 RepID=A0ABP3V6H4_9BURK